MKIKYLLVAFVALITSCHSQEKVAAKVFEEIALVNKVEFYDAKLDQPKFSCGFLLKFKNDTVAVTAKHLLKIIKPDEMKSLSFENTIKKWSLYSIDQPNASIITDSLLNENKSERLADKATYDNDWLVFSIKENHSKVKVLEARTTPLILGEKLYVVGWTRKMESGEQRVYEFEYFKTIGNRILLKEIIVPEQFGGLSGAPLLDANGLVVGIVSNGTVDPESDKKYFSPCNLKALLSFLETFPKTKP